MRSLNSRSTDNLAEDLAQLASQIASATCRFLLTLAEFDRRGGWAAAGARTLPAWVAWRCALSPGAAREYVRVARALSRLPRTTALFARGELSYSKVRAISRLSDVTHEDELLAITKDATAGQLEHVVRGYRSVAALDADARSAHARRFVHLRHDPDGSVRLTGRLSAEEGAVLAAALDAGRTALWAQERRDRAAEALRRHHAAPAPDDDPALDADAGPEEARSAGYADALTLLADTLLATDGLAGRAAPERHQVVVHVDAAALAEHRAGHLADGAPLAPSTVRRLCCDATLVTSTHRDGVTLDVGRRTRAVPSAIRRALRARDGGCRFPGCCARIRLDAHHVEHWADGGATAMDNLVLLCRHHHRALHEGGFSLVLDEHGEPQVRRPDGTLIPAHPAAPCADGRPRLRRRHVSAETLAAGSNQPYDRAAAVDAFLRMAPPNG